MVKSKSVSDRYHRQEKLIKGWDQNKINSTRVIVIGSGRLSDMILADLMSFGVGNLTRLGHSSFLDFEKINPDVNFEQIDDKLANYQLADILISDADVVIDASNSRQSKYYSAIVSQKKDMKYLSASASRIGFSFFSLNGVKPKDFIDNSIDEAVGELINYHERDYTGNDEKQGFINSIVCSAMTVDEVRKNIFTLKEDFMMNRYSNYIIKEPDHSLDNKKILQIGAGAIGTFSGLALSQMNTDLTIVDFDVVEETNLNRQFLFYNDIGKNKAIALAQKLSKYSPNIHSNTNKIGSMFDPNEYGKEYDAIFSCVDNNEARYYINNAARKHNIPLVNGGSSLFAGAAMVYFPNDTACLDCQTGGKLIETIDPKDKVPEYTKYEKRAPGECFQPSLIISNQVVGAMMVNAFVKGISGIYERSDYVAGQGIFNQNIENVCLDYCKNK